MKCACPYYDANGWCMYDSTRCEAGTEDQYCRYLCDDPFNCDSVTAEECAESNPCNPQ